MVEAVEKCEAFLARTVRSVEVRNVQADEIWGLVACKQTTAECKANRSGKRRPRWYQA